METQSIPLRPQTLVGRTALGKSRSSISRTFWPIREYALVGRRQARKGFRTMLGVPLLREGDPDRRDRRMSHRTCGRSPTSRSSWSTTFADQAVIAIENVRLFDEIQDKSQQLAEASQHKSQFLANMSHELRTPLNAILGYTELILDNIYGETPEKMRDVLERVQTQRPASARPDQRRARSVQDRGRPAHACRCPNYSLKDMVQGVYSAVEPLAAEKKLALKIEVSPDLPQGHGDERRLTQVLLNLVGNAIKFTDAGEVVVRPRPANGSFNLSVRDTGPGIGESDQAKLFQEFQQADNSITRKKGGTGLGLAISKRIIELHGGTIWVESQRRAGLDVFLYASGPRPSKREQSMSKLILVVEDQEDNRRILRDLLTSADYELIEAENGEEALAATAKDRPDLILMDIQLAGDGRLRGDPPHQGRSGVGGDPDHRRHVLRVERRRGQGARRRLRRLRPQALQPAAAAGENPQIFALTPAAISMTGVARPASEGHLQ